MNCLAVDCLSKQTQARPIAWVESRHHVSGFGGNASISTSEELASHHAHALKSTAIVSINAIFQSQSSLFLCPWPFSGSLYYLI